MAGSPAFILVSLLVTCVFHASDNRHVRPISGDFISQMGNSQVDYVFSGIPSANIGDCTDDEAVGLKREVSQLKQRLASCSSAASSVAGSYRTQLHHLLEMYDSESFQILEIMILTREVNALQKRVELAANSTEIQDKALQNELEEKTAKLNAKKEQIQRSRTNSALLLEIISLQSQIWDLQQAESRQGSALGTNRRIQVLQEQLDRKISELRSQNDAVTSVLELISVHSKITARLKTIRVLIEESRTNASDVQRQWRQKVELLKRKILQLNDDENNRQLTREILKLQGEVEYLEELMTKTKEILETKLQEVRVSLDTEKKREEILLKQLQDADYVVAQMIMKIISIMEEWRGHSQQTSTGQTQDIFTLLQSYKRDYAKAQTEIKDLQEKLQEKLRETCEEHSGLEQKEKNLRAELEKKISELNGTEDSSTALILSVITLHGDLNALNGQISASSDPNVLSKLQKQLQEKQQQLESKTADLQRLVASPHTVLTIIQMQNEIWQLQNKDNNGTTDEIDELQDRVEGLISELEEKSTENMVMIILTQQRRVEYLQKQLSELEMQQNTTVTRLTNELTAREKELKQRISELKKKNQENVDLILTITDLQQQLRNIEKEKKTEDRTASSTISKLKEQLKLKEKEHDKDQTLIKALKNKVNQIEGECSENEKKIKGLQKDIDEKLEELKSKSDTISTLVLRISTLTVQLDEMTLQLQNSSSKSKLEELQRIIDEKNEELERKTEELKRRSPQAQRLLQIIEIQAKIQKLVNLASNDTDFANIRALQDHLTSLIEGIEDKNDASTKLILQIMSQQDEITRLRKQEQSQLKNQAKQIKDLEDELEHIRNQIKEKTKVVNFREVKIANLSAQIMELHQKIQPLEDQLSDLKETYAENLAEQQERLNLTKKQLEDSELQLKNSNAKNFQLMMQITDLRAQLKKAYKQASKDAQRSITDLEEQLATQQSQNRKLESTNKDLKQQIQELETCCAVNTNCDELRGQLQQSQEDADRLHQQLQEKDAAIKRLQQDFEKQGLEKTELQKKYDNLLKKVTDVEDRMVYSTSVTMDPDTAHPRVALSAANTEVSTSEHLQNVLDHPGRFDVSLAVLGATGFSRGRNYWEVSVIGKTCYHIGMASESAPRRGSLLFKPRNGFWTIVLNNEGHLKAIDQRPVDIGAGVHPNTLGILLDYEKGEVSFYNVGDRSHIYTFSGQRFTDKIYPFINYCVGQSDNLSPIVLVPPGSTDWIK